MQAYNIKQQIDKVLDFKETATNSNETTQTYPINEWLILCNVKMQQFVVDIILHEQNHSHSRHL